MKKILLTIIAVIALIAPLQAQAQATAPAGGTGLGTYTAGDLIYAATTNPIRFTKLNIGGLGTCLTSNGSIPGWGTCGSGGSGGGAFSTTTSQVAGRLIVYPNNTTDILCIGGTATTTCKYWMDPNIPRVYLAPNVGIGTTTAYTALGVSGTIVADNYISTSTSNLTGTSTFAGSIRVGNALFNGQSAPTGFFSSSGYPQISVSHNIDDGTSPYVFGNTSPSTFAAGCITGMNAKTTFEGGVFAGYNINICMLGHNWDTFAGAQANGLAIDSTDGSIVIAALSDNYASSTINFASGSGYTVANLDMSLKNLDPVSYPTQRSMANLGIGSTSPFGRLTIVASSTNVVPYILVASSTNGTAGSSGTLRQQTLFQITPSGIASTTNLNISGITGVTQCLQIIAGVVSGTGSACGAGGGSVSNWNQQINYNVLTLTPTTTIPVWFKDQVYASSTAIFGGRVTASSFTATSTTEKSILTYASTTMLTFETASTTNLTVSGSATSSFSGGINLPNGGCFSVANVCVGGGSGAQTPWASDIAGAGFNLTGVGVASSTSLNVSNPLATTSLQGFVGIGLTLPTSPDVVNAQLTIKNQSGRTNILNFLNSAGATMGTLTNAGTMLLTGSYTTATVSMGSSALGCQATVTCTFQLNASTAGAKSVYQGSTAVSGEARVVSTSGVGTSDSISFRTGNNGSNISIINTDGNMSIGSTTVTGLSMKAAINARLVITATSSASTEMLHIDGPTTANSATSTLFRITADGTIFAPKLTQSGANQTYYMCGVATTFEMVWDTTTCLVSAAKFKKDIQAITPTEALSTVMSMQPVTYKKKDPLNKTDAGLQPGFIADSVKDPKLQETLVTKDSNGDIHGFRYEQYTAYLTGAIQAQQKEIEELKAEINKLKHENN